MQKGPATIVSDGEKVLITDRGCPGMATAGSGDVLSGILAAVCYGAAASGDKDKLLLAAASAAWINGAAGELAQSKGSAVTMTAGDTAANVSEVINGLISE
jgi:NAD(P)H-hydrate epimerase